MTAEGRLRLVPIAGLPGAGANCVNGFDNRTHIFTGSQARRIALRLRVHSPSNETTRISRPARMVRANAPQAGQDAARFPARTRSDTPLRTRPESDAVDDQLRSGRHGFVRRDGEAEQQQIGNRRAQRRPISTKTRETRATRSCRAQSATRSAMLWAKVNSCIAATHGSGVTVCAISAAHSDVFITSRHAWLSDG